MADAKSGSREGGGRGGSTDPFRQPGPPKTLRRPHRPLTGPAPFEKDRRRPDPAPFPRPGRLTAAGSHPPPRLREMAPGG